MKRHQTGPKLPTPPSPGHYRAVTMGGNGLAAGDFPSRAAARRQAVARATSTPVVAKGSPLAEPITAGYCWVETPKR